MMDVIYSEERMRVCIGLVKELGGRVEVEDDDLPPWAHPGNLVLGVYLPQGVLAKDALRVYAIFLCASHGNADDVIPQPIEESGEIFIPAPWRCR